MLTRTDVHTTEIHIQPRFTTFITTIPLKRTLKVNEEVPEATKAALVRKQEDALLREVNRYDELQPILKDLEALMWSCGHAFPERKGEEVRRIHKTLKHLIRKR